MNEEVLRQYDRLRLQENQSLLNYQTIYEMIRRNWTFLLVTILAISCAVALITMVTPQTVFAKSRLIIYPARITSLDQGARQVSDNALESIVYQTKYQLLLSHEILHRVIQHHELINDRAFQREIVRSPGSIRAFQDAEANMDHLSSTVLNRLRDHMTIRLLPNSQIVEVTASAHDPKLAEKLANIYAEEACRFVSMFQSDLYKDILNETGRKIDSLHRSIVETIQLMKDPLSLEKDWDAAVADDSEGQTLKNVVDAYQKTKLERQVLEANNAISYQRRAIIDEVRPEDEYLKSLQQEIATYQAELAEKMAKLGSDHPTIVTLKTMIGKLISQYSRQIKIEKEMNQQRVDSKMQVEQGLSAEIKRLHQQYLEQKKQRLDHQLIKNELAAKLSVYQGLIENFEKMQVEQRTIPMMIRVAEWANVPLSSRVTRLIRNTTLSAILTAFASMACLMICSLNDHSRRPLPTRC